MGVGHVDPHFHEIAHLSHEAAPHDCGDVGAGSHVRLATDAAL